MSSRRNKQESATPMLATVGVILPAPINIESPSFSGSLPLLFQCVKEGKVDLRDVPLFPICEAYFLYLVDHAADNLDEAAAALSALSYLLERKAWLLLPVDEPEPEEFEGLMELIEPSTEQYYPVIEVLRQYEEERSDLFFRSPDASPATYELPFELSNVSPMDLARALSRVLERAVPEAPKILNKPRRSLADQMVMVLKALSNEWSALDVLIPAPFTRTDVVYWFLALLELIRVGQASVRLYDGDVQFARYQDREVAADK